MCRENIAKSLARERSRSSDHFWCTIGARFPEGRYSASDIFLTMPTRSFSIVINHHVLGAWLPIYSSGQSFYGKDARRFHREWTERTTFREVFLLLTCRILFHPFPPTILWIFPIRSTWNQFYHHEKFHPFLIVRPFTNSTNLQIMYSSTTCLYFRTYRFTKKVYLFRIDNIHIT